MKLIYPNLLAPLLFNIPRAHLLASPDSQNALVPPLQQQQLALKSAHLLPSTNTIKLHDDYGPVPGDSPVRYNGDFSTSLFAIETLDMHPNPCVIESYCGVKLCGTFASNITNAHLSVNITTHFYSDNRTGGMRIEDAFKGWADVVQDGQKQDVPRKGRATVEATTAILGGWVPEANYTVAVRVHADEGLVWDLWTEFEMKMKD